MTRSEEVRDFYERMPYPAPLTNLDAHRELYRNRDRRRAEFHLMLPARCPPRGQDILIAGCGTSQAARYALRDPGDRVVGIDVSEASLRHTRELQRKYDLENLELRQLAIERVREIGRSFDLVVCTGVLHHLPDPDHGLRALRDVLRPGGAMRLMVYARYGRAEICMMQEYCRLLEIGRRRRISERSAPRSRRCRRTTRSPISCAGRRISGGRKRWRTRFFIPRIAPIPCRRSMPGSTAAACPSVAGSSRRRIWPNVEAWRRALMLRGSPRCPRPRSTPRSSSFAERWCHTVSSPTATTAPMTPSRSHSPAIVGASTSQSPCRGRCAFASACPPAASRY